MARTIHYEATFCAKTLTGISFPNQKCKAATESRETADGLKNTLPTHSLPLPHTRVPYAQKAYLTKGAMGCFTVGNISLYCVPSHSVVSFHSLVIESNFVVQFQSTTISSLALFKHDRSNRSFSAPPFQKPMTIIFRSCRSDPVEISYNLFQLTMVIPLLLQRTFN